MSAPGPSFRLAVAVVLALASVTLPACGGGGSSTSSGPVARFTADTPAPGNATVAMLAGGSTGAAVTVRVTVTGVSSFFGTAFRVTYDPTALLFSSLDSSASFLREGVNPDDVVFIEDHLTNAGQVVITATRKDPTLVTPVDVTTTADLLVLTFVARKPLAAAAPEGRLDFGDPKQVCDGSVAAPGCGSIAVTWSGGSVTAQ